MRRGLLVVVCSFMLTACGAAIGTGANGAPTSTDYDEVGFIDMARILRETTRGREIAARLADAQRQVMSRLSDMQAQLDTIAEDLDAARAADEPDQGRIEELTSEYRATAEEGRRIESAGREQLEAYRTELSMPLIEEVHQVCETIGRDEAFALIVDRVGLSYANPTADLTDRVIAEVGGGGGSAVLIDEALRAPAEGRLPSVAPADPEDPPGSSAPDDPDDPAESAPSRP